MNAEIVSIGTEILMGELVDTNSPYIAAELAKLGIKVHWVSKVGDNPKRLFDVLEQAWRRSDITITSGGLGPTSDDITRETIAAVMGERMEIQEDLLTHLKNIFADRPGGMPSTNIKQATLIPSAISIPNPVGTAPGWWVEKDSHIIISTPGPPRELEHMWIHEISPRLKKINSGVSIITRTIKTFGISEGRLDEMLSHLFKSDNPILGIYSKRDGIHLRAIATSTTEEGARTLIQPMENEIRAIVGNGAIWGKDDETPESQVAEYLKNTGQTLGIMEDYTGGLLSSTLAEIEGSEEFIGGAIVIHGETSLAANGVDRTIINKHGAISLEGAEAMAEAARNKFNADIGISVTGTLTNSKSHDSPSGSSFIGFALKNDTWAISGRYPTQHSRIRYRAVNHALIELIRLATAPRNHRK